MEVGRSDEKVREHLQNMTPKVIILDFDGVIVESVGIKDHAFEVLFADYPQQLNDIVAYHLSHNAVIRFEKFRHITENILRQHYTDERANELQTKYSEFILEKIVRCPLVEGAEDFLNHFSKTTPLFLASVNPASELEEILDKRNLKRFFKKMYAHPWLKKDSILDILKNENKFLSEAVFIGDSLEDLLAARGAGVFFVGRNSGKSFGGADIPVYQNLAEIKQYLENFVNA